MTKLTIGAKKLDQLKKMPLIQQRVFKTKDNRFVVQQTRISTIKPVQYYEKVLENDVSDDLEFGW